MSYFWVPNIRCSIQGDVVSVISDLANKPKCSGVCSSCAAFLGVQPADVGERYYRSCCKIIKEMEG
jgi:hypothetical protein